MWMCLCGARARSLHREIDNRLLIKRTYSWARQCLAAGRRRPCTWSRRCRRKWSRRRAAPPWSPACLLTFDMVHWFDLSRIKTQCSWIFYPPWVDHARITISYLTHLAALVSDARVRERWMRMASTEYMQSSRLIDSRTQTKSVAALTTRNAEF